MKELYELECNKEYYAVMANDIIKGKQSMTVQEARLIRLLVTQIVKEDKDLKTYKISVKDLAEFLKVDKSNLYKDIRQICESLMTRVVKIGTGNPKEPWQIIHWVQLAKYDGAGTITLMLSNQIQPFLIGLNAWFTQYQLKNILAMQSFYAIRLYELLKLTLGENKNNKNKQYIFSVKYLREYFDCEKKLKQIGDFRRKVLNIAVHEVNEYSEFLVEYSVKKSGRTITDIVFSVTEKKLKEIKIDNPIEETKEKEISILDLVEELQEIILEPLRIKDLKAILGAAKNDLEVVKNKYELSKNQDIDNLAAWLIKAIEEDYQEPVKTAKKQARKPKKQPNAFNNFPQREYTSAEIAELEKKLLKKSMKNE